LFRILFRRNNLVPEDMIFIDDSIKNIDAARALGLHAIHFRSAGQLEQEMLQLGVLRAGA
jgi:2-haloacid dehalogenase